MAKKKLQYAIFYPKEPLTFKFNEMENIETIKEPFPINYLQDKLYGIGYYDAETEDEIRAACTEFGVETFRLISKEKVLLHLEKEDCNNKRNGRTAKYGGYDYTVHTYTCKVNGIKVVRYENHMTPATTQIPEKFKQKDGSYIFQVRIAPVNGEYNTFKMIGRKSKALIFL